MKNKTELELRDMSLIDKVIHFCLYNRLITLLFVLGLISWGVIVSPFDWKIDFIHRDPVPVDAIPDIGENQQIVFTKWMGRSPQDIEDQVTYPLTTALLGLPEVKTVRSLSMLGFSSIYVIFKEDAEFYWSRSRLLEKLSSLPPGTLPEGVKPTMGPDATGLGQVFWYTLEGYDEEDNPVGGWDLHELRSVQDWYVKYGLMGAEGVSEVASVGGYVKEYQIDINPDAMRAHGVTLNQVYNAVKNSNLDVGARTIEVNSVEYLVRGVGFIKKLADIEEAVVKADENLPIRVKDIASVTYGPAVRRGLIDKEGSEAVGGVVVARYGENPLKVIENIKEKIENITPGLPSKKLADGTISKIKIVPFYDRSGLIKETLDTLNDAIYLQILITIIVILIMLNNIGSSVIVSSILPLAVLISFIGMKIFKVDANIVSLSGIAIAIGTIVDMGIILSENILSRVKKAPPDADRKKIVFTASSEVGSAIFTAVLTTIISFLPVFFMTGAEGKLFKPLAYSKTFALVASILLALTMMPALVYTFLCRKPEDKNDTFFLLYKYIIPSIAVLIMYLVSWWMGVLVFVLYFKSFLEKSLSGQLKRYFPILINAIAVGIVTYILTIDWSPLGLEKTTFHNLLFVVLFVGILLLIFQVFIHYYTRILHFFLEYKWVFLIPVFFVFLLGLSIWLGFKTAFSMGLVMIFVSLTLFVAYQVYRVGSDKVSMEKESKLGFVLFPLILLVVLGGAVFIQTGSKKLISLPEKTFELPVLSYLDKTFTGLGKEFMPPLDEGSYLLMPTTMVHASLGEVKEVLAYQDMAMKAIPEVESVVGKLGRVESPLDPAPVSMIETVINYKSEYKQDENGTILRFKFDSDKGYFLRNKKGELIEDSDGKPFRQWRDSIKNPDDIWDEIVKAAAVPGVTSAPKLQPIATRIVMLQSGMRAPMGVKVKGPSLEIIEKVGLEIEKHLKDVEGVSPPTVFADRIVGKPYLEIEIDREAIGRYGLSIKQVQDVIEIAIGGKTVTTTVEGRERYAVRLRYPREQRGLDGTLENLKKIIVPVNKDMQIPLGNLTKIVYRQGPQVIKSEDTFLTGYVLFDKVKTAAEVDVVEAAQEYLQHKRDIGELEIPAGVTYEFAGSYQNQVRSQKTLNLILPIALFIIFVIIYLQFKQVTTTFLVFIGIFVAWSGGFIMIWCYGQEWFLDFTLFGINFRDLFQIHTINLSVAIWVGFLALFGIASDDGVVICTYLKQKFEGENPVSVKEIRQLTVEAAARRVRPALMTSATTILALLPILTSTGRGSDVMIPMAIPSFGGMFLELMTIFLAPVLYCMIEEVKLKNRLLKKGRE